MVKVEIVKKYDEYENRGNSIIKIDGRQMTINEYNNPDYGNGDGARPGFSDKWYLKIDEEFIKRSKAARELWGEIGGSIKYKESDNIPPGKKVGDYHDDETQKKEILKNRKVDLNLYNDVVIRLVTPGASYLGHNCPTPNQNSFRVLNILQPNTLEDTVKHNNKIWEDNFEFWKETNNLVLKLKELKDDSGQTPGEDYVPQEPLSQEEAKKLEALRKQIREKINEELNKDPIISSNELSDNNWSELLSHSKTEQRINELRDRVLNDIESKRNAKKGKRKREDEKNDSPTQQPDNKKPKLDDKDKESYDVFVKNGISEAVEKNELKGGLEIAIRMEGETKFNNEKLRKEIEEKYWEIDPKSCRDTIIAALKERLNDNNVSIDKLSEEVKKLINSEITDTDKFKTVKEQAIKEIGQKGAESKWTSLFSQAKSLLDKAKKNATDKVKKDLKVIQEQLKSFKSGANSYLSSFYQKEKSKIDKLESDLSSYSNQNQTGSPTPWGIIIPVSLAVIALIGIIAAVIVRKRKKIS